VTKTTDLKQIKNYSEFINEQLKVKRSAGIAIVWQGQVLLAHTTGRNFKTGYGIPKGGIDPGETELQAAIRETFEEVGIKVPKKLIDRNPHTFAVTSRKYKYNKIVTYFIAEIDSLEQIGLKEPKVPKSQLQIEEVNDARFLDRNTASNVIMKSQIDLINTLVNKGLLK
jgi:8-oxo-dGTP pyrophosphatase MutT (NUDIX family)